jgi:lipase
MRTSMCRGTVAGMSVLHVHEFGDHDAARTPVLGVHGIGAHGRRFRRLAQDALPHRRTVAVDLRGHGRSTYDGPWSNQQHVADLIDTLDALALRQVDVVSHSYGGVLALALLAAAPERVRSVALLDPALAQPGAMASEMAMGVIEHPGFADIDEATRWRSGDLGDEIHPNVVEEIEEHLVPGDDGRYRFRVHRPAVVTAWGELCHPLPTALRCVPALLVAADRADFVTPEVESGLAQLFAPDFHSVHLDAGHMVYWERFEETADAVERFLADVDARTA